MAQPGGQDFSRLAGAAEGAGVDGGHGAAFGGQPLGQEFCLQTAAFGERAVGRALPGAADIGGGLAVADDEQRG